MSKTATGILVSLAIAAVCGAFPASAGDDAASKKQELQRVKREMREKKREIRRAERKERSILSELEKTDRELQAGGAELAEQQKKLQEAETALREIEQSNAVVSIELGRLKSMYRARLRALYKMERTGGYATAVLSSESFPSALKRVKYLGSIAGRDRRLILDYGNALEQLEKRQSEAREQARDIRGRRLAVEAKRAHLETRRRMKAELLASVKQKKGVYEETLRELEESSASLWSMIRKAEQERRTVKVPPAPRASGPASVHGKDRFPWPVSGQVLTRFGAQRHPDFGTMVYRRGIEIEARTGDDVRAVGEGQVAYADWYKGYGKLIILEHGPGFHTLYGHLSQLNVNKGDRVTRAQVIARAGDTGSLKGPKLYFEIRRNGEAEDPLLWLAKR